MTARWTRSRTLVPEPGRAGGGQAGGIAPLCPSSWSSPVSPFASLRHGSATYRVAATVASSWSETSVGARAREEARSSGSLSKRRARRAPHRRGFRWGPQEAGLVQDTAPLRVTEGLVHEGLQAVWGGIDIPVDLDRAATAGSLRWHPPPPRPPASGSCGRAGASRSRRDLATCSRDSRRESRSARRAGKARKASPQRSRSSSVATTSVEGTPILPGWRPVASTVAVPGLVVGAGDDRLQLLQELSPETAVAVRLPRDCGRLQSGRG